MDTSGAAGEYEFFNKGGHHKVNEQVQWHKRLHNMLHKETAETHGTVLGAAAKQVEVDATGPDEAVANVFARVAQADKGKQT